MRGQTAPAFHILESSTVLNPPLDHAHAGHVCFMPAGPHGLLSGLDPAIASAVKVAVVDLLLAQPPVPPAYTDIASAVAAANAAAANAQLARKSPKNATPTHPQQQGVAGTGVASSPFAAVSPRVGSVTGHVTGGCSSLVLRGCEVAACTQTAFSAWPPRTAAAV